MGKRWIGGDGSAAVVWCPPASGAGSVVRAPHVFAMSVG
jgi:hypothetical protein